MEILAGLATLSFVAVAAVVGTRLLMLARRTRQTPELAIGLALILVVFLGYPLQLVPLRPGIDPELAQRALVVGAVVTALGQCCVYVFTRAVFRPREAWARALTGAAIVGILVLATVEVARVARGSGAVELRLDGTLLAAYLLYTLGYAWTAIEAFRYHGLLRKRQAIGLADPVVANRFLLWAVSGTSATVGLSVSIAAALLGDGALTGHPTSMLVLGLAGVTSAATTYLAFMPPAVWVRWVGGSARAPSA